MGSACMLMGLKLMQDFVFITVGRNAGIAETRASEWYRIYLLRVIALTVID